MTQGGPSDGCILVVDDESTIRKLLKRHLERRGYEVLLAENGAEALRVLHSSGDRIRLVILDMIMPGMTGLEALIELRRTHHSLPVLISSGYNQDEDRAQASAIGVNGFLGKPFSLRDLTAIVRSTIGEDAD